MYGSVTLLREQCPQAWRAWRQGMCCVQISFVQLAIYFLYIKQYQGKNCWDSTLLQTSNICRKTQSFFHIKVCNHLWLRAPVSRASGPRARCPQRSAAVSELTPASLHLSLLYSFSSSSSSSISSSFSSTSTPSLVYRSWQGPIPPHSPTFSRLVKMQVILQSGLINNRQKK